MQTTSLLREYRCQLRRKLSLPVVRGRPSEGLGDAERLAAHGCASAQLMCESIGLGRNRPKKEV